MTRAARKDTFRTIRKTLSRYCSILLIVAIGVGFFAGIRATGTDMRSTASHYYTETNTMDVHLLSTLGFSETDVEEVMGIEGVRSVMPSKFIDCLTVCSDNFVTHVASLPKDLSEDSDNYQNRLRVLEGRMPENAGECIIDQNIRDKYKFSVGDTLTLAAAESGQKLSDDLERTEFTVVGVVNSPLYIDMTKRGTTTVGDGSLDAFVYIFEENFTADYYSELFVTSTEAGEFLCYTDDYQNTISALIDRLEALGELRAEPRLIEMRVTSQQKIDDARQQIEDAKVEIADGKQQLIDAEQKLSDGKVELADADKKYQDGKETFDKEIADAQHQLNFADSQLQSGWNQFYTGLAKYEESKKQLEASLPQVEKAEADLQQLTAAYQSLDATLATMTNLPDDTTRKVYADSIKGTLNSFTDAEGSSLGLGNLLYDESGNVTGKQVALTRANLTGYYQGVKAQVEKARADYEAGVQQLAAAKAQLDNAYSSLMVGGDQYSSGLEEFNKQKDEGQKELDDAAQEIADAKIKLLDAEAEYDEKSADARQQIADAEVDVADAERKLADAEKKLADLKPAEWYVDDRADANPGYAEFSDDADRMDNISTIFPVFFLAVAALVCLTTMARMVEEHRTEIGTFKALGYDERSIQRKYLIYSLSATVLGCVIGLLVGFKLFPTVIYDAYCILYDLPDVIAPFHWDVALLCCAVAILCVLLVTRSVCRSVLRENPASIMRPKAPPSGKRVLLERIPFLWKRFSFSQKVTTRNLFRYKKRVLMTIFGIAGCSALILTGYGLNDAIGDIVTNQFEKVFHYDILAAYSDADAEETKALYSMLEESDEVDEWMPQYRQTMNTVGGDKAYEINLVVSQDYTKLEDYISLQERKSGKDLDSPREGVVITEKLSDLMGLFVGDTLTLRDSDNKEYSMAIVGIGENYASHFVYLSQPYYEEIFGEVPEYNSVIINLTDPAQLHEFSAELIAGGTIQMISSNADLLDQYKNVTQNLGYVVAVLIVSAGLLAFVVLYNLSNINITERTREIATLKVLGFYDGEVSAYIYRENIILTILGAGVGLLLGVGLTSFVVATAEIDSIMFGRNIYWPSFLIAAALTFLFSFLVNWVMHYRLKKISMVESMKSID